MGKGLGPVLDGWWRRTAEAACGDLQCCQSWSDRVPHLHLLNSSLVAWPPSAAAGACAVVRHLQGAGAGRQCEVVAAQRRVRKGEARVSKQSPESCSDGCCQAVGGRVGSLGVC